MTIIIAFHQSGYRTFKHFYEKHVCVYWCAEFPNLVSYSRFVQLKKEVLQLLTIFLDVHLGACSGTSFVIPRVCACMITSGFQHIVSSLNMRGVQKPLWAGSLALNFT